MSSEEVHMNYKKITIEKSRFLISNFVLLQSLLTAFTHFFHGMSFTQKPVLKYSQTLFTAILSTYAFKMFLAPVTKGLKYRNERSSVVCKAILNSQRLL